MINEIEEDVFRQEGIFFTRNRYQMGREITPVFRTFAHVESAMRLMTVYMYLTSYSLTLQSPAIKIDTDVS